MLRSRLALFFGIVTGVAASQIPEYAQQYRQRLGGAIDELQTIVTTFDDDSARQGLSEDEGIARLLASKDEFVSGRGVQMKDVSARLQKLTRSNEAMAQAGPIGRLTALAADFDPLIARRAYASFEPAVPVTGEGFALGGLGFVAGFGVWQILSAPFRRRGRSRPKSAALQR
ncbi:conserved hypothetical protein [Methylocella silvestris BL2]|uniref:DUF2937 domain-containing protein n=1 Tax=Methylocella silvestris (strain DSM 15510 / CIP 108128 / LMG 27833 / NCIMB 13906 / BL2) TaxID=395965 RepID=B8EKQ2_METSB|nr:DUF2937 family protein [Methylocella silvestris]ACK51930.1 conserved hypothetical protein [Methylocella silvestris BL2]